MTTPQEQWHAEADRLKKCVDYAPSEGDAYSFRHQLAEHLRKKPSAASPQAEPAPATPTERVFAAIDKSMAEFALRPRPDKGPHGNMAEAAPVPAPAPDAWLKEAMRLANALAQCDQDSAHSCLGAEADQKIRAVAYNALEKHIRLRVQPAPARLSDEREALTELVACNGTEERLKRLHDMGHGTDYDQHRRQFAAAWERARALLAAAPVPAPVPDAPATAPSDAEIDAAWDESFKQVGLDNYGRARHLVRVILSRTQPAPDRALMEQALRALQSFPGFVERANPAHRERFNELLAAAITALSQRLQEGQAK